MDRRNSTRTLLLVLGGAFLPYGLYCFAFPGFLAGTAGVAATTPTGVAEIRAMYGGLQAAFGLLLFAAWRDPRLTVAGLATVAFVMPGLALARLLGVALGGGISTYTAGALVFEIVSSVFAISMLRRELSAASHSGSGR